MPERNKQAEREEGETRPSGPRPFWSGTISFGLVTVPVNLFVGVRSASVPLRMVSEDGHPLSRQYFCPKEDKPLEPDELVRGYEVEKDRYVVVSDEELASVAPEQSQAIDLQQFVAVDDIDPMYFERAYFLTPAKGSSKPYRLLARVMEDSGRAGIASFVMRGKQYLVAIIARDGILKAETLRFTEELREPADVGLEKLPDPPKDDVQAFRQAIQGLSKKRLDTKLLRDRQNSRLLDRVETKLKAGEDVFEAPEPPDADDEEPGGAKVIDLMSVLKRSLEQGADENERSGRKSGGNKQQKTEGQGKGKGKGSGRRNASKQSSRSNKGKRKSPGKKALRGQSKDELYDRAQQLEIAGRSRMSKDELVDAIAAAG